MNISLKFNKIEILNKCRICLLKSGTWLIFSSYGEDKIDIRTIYESYTGIKVEEDDNMPKKLCSGCLDDLIATHEFIEKCKTADTVLHNLETVLAYDDPTGFKVVVIQGESTLEFEYDDCVEPCTVVEEGVKDEQSDLLDVELTKTDCDPNVFVINTSSNNYDDSLVFQQDTVDVQKLCTDLVSSTDMIKKEYEASSLEGQTEINVSNDLLLLNGFNGSWEDLVNSNDEEHDISNSSNDDKEINDTEINTLNNRVIKNITKNKMCPICLTGFRRKDTLINHMRTHTQERPFKCTICSAEFSSGCNLTRHSRVHTGEKPYVCDICGKDFIQSKNLELHKQIHGKREWHKKYGKPLMRILCSYCGLVFISNQKYVKHLQNAHDNIDLKYEDKEKFSHLCKVCGRYLSSRNCLRVHMATHTATKNYLCSYCGRKFLTKGVLDAHISIHTGERPYKCKFCSKSFSQRSTLISHQYIHTGTKPYQCNLCDKGFKQSHQLSYHLLTHTGEKPFSCAQCGKKLATKRILMEHIRIHTGEKPHSCSYCGKGFKCYSGFRKHLEIHKRIRIEV